MHRVNGVHPFTVDGALSINFSAAAMPIDDLAA